MLVGESRRPLLPHTSLESTRGRPSITSARPVSSGPLSPLSEWSGEGPARELLVKMSWLAAAAISTASHTLTTVPRRRGSSFSGRQGLSPGPAPVRRRRLRKLPRLLPGGPGGPTGRCQGLVSCCSVWTGPCWAAPLPQVPVASTCISVLLSGLRGVKRIVMGTGISLALW